MKKLKKTLALLLAVCMMVTVIPTDVVASETTGKTEEETKEETEAETEEEIEEETKEETEAETEEEIEEETKEETEEETEKETEEETEKETEEETKEETEEETKEETEAETEEETEAETKKETEKRTERRAAYANRAYSKGISTTSVNSAKPENGQTNYQPFNSGTGGSKKFRIPALITLNDGTMVAAADARWDHTKDAANIDIITSYSEDNGASWNYSFANYIDDTNGNASSTDYKAATFMDPALATDGETVYLLTDLFPGQTSNSNCIAVVNEGTGYDEEGYLKLSSSGSLSSSSYDYYVKDGVIYDYATNTDQGYEVDAYFEVSKEGVNIGNLFNYGKTGFYPLQTSYLYLTKSTNGGVTWSEPVVLNNQVKYDWDMFYGVAPGRGLVTESGRIIFPCYIHGSSSEYTSLIYSDDDGETWNRTSNATSGTVWSSEAQMVELENGTIRTFFRNGEKQVCYVDATPVATGYTWGNVVYTGLYSCSNTMMSAIKYSQYIDGKEAIIISYPASSKSYGDSQYDRVNGKIVVGLVGDDGKMSWDYMYSVNNTYFWYSCLTELEDGNIGLLYETGSDGATIKYASYAITDLVGTDAVIGDSAAGDDGSNDDEISNSIIVSSDGVADWSGDLEGVKVEESRNEYVANKLEGKLTNYRAYDITVPGFVNGTEVTVTLPIPQGVESPEVYYVSNNGEIVVDMNATNNGDGTVSFVTDHFSIYVVGEGVTSVDVELAVGKSKTYTMAGEISDYSIEDDTIADMEVTVQQEVEGSGGYEAVSAKIDTLVTSEDVNNPNAIGYYYKVGDEYYPVYGYSEPKSIEMVTKYIWGYYQNGVFYQIDSKYSYFGSNVETELYALAGTEEIPASTTVVFTGLKVGNTNATVGNVVYNISVKAEEKALTVKIDDTVSTTVVGIVTADDIKKFNESNGAYVTVALSTDGTQLIFRGVAEGSVAEALLGGTKYTINVEDIPITVTVENTPFTRGTGKDAFIGKKTTKLTISENVSFDINVSVSENVSVEWVSLDSSIAEVDENGKITGKTVGTTYVMCTIKENDGTTVTHTLPVVVLDTVDENLTQNYVDGICDFYIDEISNVEVVYNIDMSKNAAGENVLLSTEEGESIYLGYRYSNNTQKKTPAFAVNFFAKQDDGYALSFMASTNSDGNYYGLKGPAEKASDLSAYKEGALNNAKTYWSAQDDILPLLQQGIRDGYNGTMGWTRGVNNPGTEIYSALTFQAEKLPTISKALNGVLGIQGTVADYRRYAGEEMIGAVDEFVFFTIEILQEEPITYKDTINYTSAIEYDAELIDELEGSYFYTKDEDIAYGKYDGILEKPLRTKDVSNALNAKWSQAERDAGYRKLEYYVAYKITTADFNSIIKNKVVLDYTYKSYYGSSSSSASGSATANLRVVGKYMDSIVADYGLPISIKDVEGKYEFKNIDIKTTLEKNGLSETELQIMQIDGVHTLTYTPSKIMTTAVPIVLYNNVGQSINSFVVYPATSVYYEEDFINWDSAWTKNGTASVNSQEYRTLGQNTAEGSEFDAYGFDKNYANNSGPSAGTYATTAVKGAIGTFGFTGTGVEIYANCTKDSGTVSCLIKNSAGKTVRLSVVDTAIRNGSTGATSYEDNEHNHMPIITYKDLPYDTYDVTVKAWSNDNKSVYIDGVRVHGTIKDQRIYESDLEDNPRFYELRDMVLCALDVSDIVTDVEDNAKKIATQIYDKLVAEAAKSETAVDKVWATVTDARNEYDSDDKIQDLLKNGPKNELFLYPGQSLVFNVTTSRLMQIGLKAPTGLTKYKITVNGTEGAVTDLKSSVDMFYQINNIPTRAATEYSITVANAGDAILAVTLLKICDDPNAFFNALTAKDMEHALTAMGYEFSEESKKPTTSTGSNDSKDDTEVKDESQSTPVVVVPSIKEETSNTTPVINDNVSDKKPSSTETNFNEETMDAPIIDEVAKVEDSTESEVEVEQPEVSAPTVEAESGNPIGLIAGIVAAVVAAAVILFFGFKKKSKNK